MTTTLADFLLARIAEDEAALQKLLRYAQENELTISDPQMLGRRIPGWHEWPDVQAVCTRSLAECDAKRQRVEALSRGLAGRQFGTIAMFLLKLDGLPYADHPDYRQEWRP